MSEGDIPRGLLGIDYGERRIGIAASDGAVAVPVSILTHESRESDLQRVATLVEERRPQCIIIGLPVLAAGGEGEQARRARRFGDALARIVSVPIVYHDESFSSVEAEARGSARGRGRAKGSAKTYIDDVAAAVILQSYIDAQASTR